MIILILTKVVDCLYDSDCSFGLLEVLSSLNPWGFYMTPCLLESPLVFPGGAMFFLIYLANMPSTSYLIVTSCLLGRLVLCTDLGAETDCRG